MFKRTAFAITAAVLLFGTPASAHADGSVSLSKASTGTCGEGDTCINTFDASWDPGRTVGPLGGTLKVEATRAQFSDQRFSARFAMVVSVPPSTREITLSSVWRLVGSATTVLGNTLAGCSVAHPQVGYETVSTVDHGTGPFDREFVFTKKLTSSKSFPRQMTLWAELRCVAQASALTTSVTNLPQTAELVLQPDSADSRGTALLHLHATFAP